MNKKILFLIMILMGIGALLLVSVFFIGATKSNSNNINNTAPSLLSISPTGLPQGSVGVTVRVYGRNFNDKSIIHWNGLAVPTDTKNVAHGFLTTAIPASYFTNYGEYPITVTNESGDTSGSINFTVMKVFEGLPSNTAI